MTGSRLEKLAREFAGDISTLLTRTVTHGIRLSTVLQEPSLCILGHEIGRRNLRPTLIPLTIGQKNATAYFFVACILEMDAEGTYLTVNKSGVGLYATDSLDEMVFHYDYNRVPPNEYPSAHFQVAGQSEPLAAVIARSGNSPKTLHDLHFPVGGRRFRPTIEDVVEFLVIEGFADAKPNWEAAVAERREAWKEIQIKAAVRRYAPWAAETLREAGYDVSAPAD